MSAVGAAIHSTWDEVSGTGQEAQRAREDTTETSHYPANGESGAVPGTGSDDITWFM